MNIKTRSLIEYFEHIAQTKEQKRKDLIKTIQEIAFVVCLFAYRDLPVLTFNRYQFKMINQILKFIPCDSTICLNHCIALDLDN